MFECPAAPSCAGKLSVGESETLTICALKYLQIYAVVDVVWAGWIWTGMCSGAEISHALSQLTSGDRRGSDRNSVGWYICVVCVCVCGSYFNMNKEVWKKPIWNEALASKRWI